jgi:hypothetical protein
LVFPADFYFNPIDDGDAAAAPLLLRMRLETEPRLSAWISRVFSVRIPAGGGLPQPRFGGANTDYLGQELAARVPADHFLLYDGERLAVGRGLRRQLECTEEYSVLCDPLRQLLTIEGGRRVDGIEPLAAFATRLAVGELGLHFALDLRVGRTLAFRVEYSEPPAFAPTAAFECDGEPSTCVSDRHALAATFCADRLTLWHIASASPHRALAFDVLVRAAAFDPQTESLIVATVSELVFLSINGEVLAKCAIDTGTRVSCATFVGNAEVKHGAFCGTDNGELWFAVPLYESGEVDLRPLTSPHLTDGAEIRELIVHRLKGGMLSVDKRGRVCAWTCLSETHPPRLNPGLFRKCHACRKPPTTCCAKCSLALCDGCSHERNPGRCHRLGSAD